MPQSCTRIETCSPSWVMVSRFGSLGVFLGSGGCVARFDDNWRPDAGWTRQASQIDVETLVVWRSALHDNVERSSQFNAIAEWVAGVRAILPFSPLELLHPSQGTPFQRTVWRALTAIPRGQTRSYRQVAVSVGRPASVRAVASACAANPLALIIPCHRVVAADGRLAGYRWGLARKQALLAWESSLNEAQQGDLGGSA